MSESMTSDLRAEIVESEKARLDFLKWKIILVAGTAVVGFGLSKDIPNSTATIQGIPVVLGFIPLISAYVDVICVHNDLRILVIASFLRTHGTEAARDYERLCLQQGRSFFLESFALLGATLMFSVLVFVVAWYDMSAVMPSTKIEPGVSAFLIGTSGIGATASILAMLFKRWRVRSLAANEAVRLAEKRAADALATERAATGGLQV